MSLHNFVFSLLTVLNILLKKVNMMFSIVRKPRTDVNYSHFRSKTITSEVRKEQVPKNLKNDAKTLLQNNVSN